MLATDATGLAGSATAIVGGALLVGRGGGRLKPGGRALVLAGVGVMALIPLGTLSLAGYLRGLTGDLSISTLVLLLRAAGTHVGASRPVEERDRVALQVFLAGTGAILYPLALGLGPFDPYRLGYASPWLMGALLIVTLIGCGWRLPLLTWCVCLAVLAYSVGWYESNNLWDYLLDPMVALYALSALVVRATTHRGTTDRKG